MRARMRLSNQNRKETKTFGNLVRHGCAHHHRHQHHLPMYITAILASQTSYRVKHEEAKLCFTNLTKVKTEYDYLTMIMTTVTGRRKREVSVCVKYQ